MNFLDLIKLIHQTTKKSTKWPDEDIFKVFVKCHHLHELNELLLFCKYQDYEADGMSKLHYNIVCIFSLYINVILNSYKTYNHIYNSRSIYKSRYDAILSLKHKLYFSLSCLWFIGIFV